MTRILDILTPFSWECPHCERATTITQSGYDRFRRGFHSGIEKSFYYLYVELISCPSSDCHLTTIRSELYPTTEINGQPSIRNNEPTHNWNLVPSSSSKQFPSYVPKAIIEDYQEACSIKNLSPKASATLSRRCLQGMIRDFWSITKKTLHLEINALSDLVDPLTWQGIDAVRAIGNIGAHMEKDINIIVEVDPDEAQLLINLIEFLIKDWYIVRHEKKQQLEAIIATSKSKSKARKTAPQQTRNPAE